MDQEPTHVFIMGWDIDDYKQSRQSIPPGFTILRCGLCNIRTVISPDGVKELDKWGSRAVVICNPCGLIVVALGNSNVETIVTDYAARNMGENGRRILDFMEEMRKRHE